MHTSEQSNGEPAIDRRAARPGDESPLAMLAKLPAVRVLSQLPVPVLAVSSDGSILFANDAFYTMLGYQRDTAGSMAFDDVFAIARTDECAVSTIREHAEGLVDLVHADGTVVHALMSRSALQRVDDDVALVSFQDLTEKLWSEGR